MHVLISKAREQFKQLWLTVTDDESVAQWLADLLIEDQLTGNRFNAFEEILLNVSKGPLKTDAFTIVVDRPGTKLIDFQGAAAYAGMKDVVPQALEWVKQEGTVYIGFKNSEYHEFLGSIARKFAEQNLICIYSANAGPQGVVAYGGRKSIFGTNPLTYAIPTSGHPIFFDAATAQYAYGTIRLAKKAGQKLEERTYLDEQGDWTTDPERAFSLIPFGGYKGYAINLLLEVLTGALVGGKSGTLQNGQNEIGGFMLLIDPTTLGSLEDFKRQTDQLVADIESDTPAEGFTEVRVPGSKALKLRDEQLARGYFEVEDQTYETFAEEYQRLTTNK